LLVEPAAWPLAAYAQTKVARLGFPGVASATGFQAEALRAGLRDFGYIEGNNILIEYRFAEGRYERLPELAATSDGGTSRPGPALMRCDIYRLERLKFAFRPVQKLSTIHAN
jgi:hypothetical protein